MSNWSFKGLICANMLARSFKSCCQSWSLSSHLVSSLMLMNMQVFLQTNQKRSWIVKISQFYSCLEEKAARLWAGKDQSALILPCLPPVQYFSPGACPQ